MVKNPLEKLTPTQKLVSISLAYKQLISRWERVGETLHLETHKAPLDEVKGGKLGIEDFTSAKWPLEKGLGKPFVGPVNKEGNFLLGNFKNRVEGPSKRVGPPILSRGKF